MRGGVTGTGPACSSSSCLRPLHRREIPWSLQVYEQTSLQRHGGALRHPRPMSRPEVEKARATLGGRAAPASFHLAEPPSTSQTRLPLRRSHVPCEVLLDLRAPAPAAPVGLGGEVAPTLDDTGHDPRRGPVSVRWVLVHMIEEYARRNGQADL